jgi:small GTP-binding protein
MSVVTKKICLLGDFSVGKSSMIRRFIEDKFSDNYLSTVGVKVSRKSLTITGDRIHEVTLLIWDLEGHTKFKSITPTYLKGSSGAIIVADLTRSDTLDNLDRHIKLFLEINPNSVIALALNKADLIREEKLDRLIELYGSNSCRQAIDTYQTSAKTGQHVDTIFEKLTTAIIHHN